MRSRRGLGSRREVLRGAAAGAAAASAWSALEPLAASALGTGYTDVRLLGGLARAGRLWRPVGTALHAANGAAFGAIFARLGGRGPRAALAWTGIELVATWPLMALADRWHPDRLEGRWPPLLSDRRIIGQEVAMHALFGLLLGLMTREGPAGR